jgi:succinate dehydrogenase / fumarate reductase cytochrome b subunit
MKTLILAQGSSIFKKMILASSGLILVLFTIVHLLGNLLIYSQNPDLLNLYADRIERWGLWYRLAEIVILISFLVHIGYASVISWENKQARSESYHRLHSAGHTSQQSIFSRSMIWTGSLLLLFLLFHLHTFRFGLGITDGYITEINGVVMRDLYRLVIETFQQPIYAIGYILAMIVLGFHLRHGVKSACQSLGLNFPGWRKFLDSIAMTISIVLSLGFMSVTLFIFGRFYH